MMMWHFLVMVLAEDVTPQRWLGVLMQQELDIWTNTFEAPGPSSHHKTSFCSGSSFFIQIWLRNRHCCSSFITEDAFAEMCLQLQHLSWAGGCWRMPQSVGVQFPHPLGAGSSSLPTTLWRKMEQVPFLFKQRTHTTSLAGFQKAAQCCGNKKALAVEEKKKAKRKKRPHACCCITFSHPLTPQLAFLWQDTLSPAPDKKKKKSKHRKKIDSFTSNA